MNTYLFVVDTGSVDPSTLENAPKAGFGPAGATWHSLALITLWRISFIQMYKLYPLLSTSTSNERKCNKGWQMLPKTCNQTEQPTRKQNQELGWVIEEVQETYI